jgi:hypothetical protein
MFFVGPKAFEMSSEQSSPVAVSTCGWRRRFGGKVICAGGRGSGREGWREGERHVWTFNWIDVSQKRPSPHSTSHLSLCARFFFLPLPSPCVPSANDCPLPPSPSHLGRLEGLSLGAVDRHLKRRTRLGAGAALDADDLLLLRGGERHVDKIRRGGGGGERATERGVSVGLEE